MILYLGLPRTFGGGDGARLHGETGATEIVLIACPTASPTLPDSTLLSAAQGHPGVFQYCPRTGSFVHRHHPLQVLYP